MNKEGYDDIDVVLERGTKALSPAEFEAIANETDALYWMYAIKMNTYKDIFLVLYL